MKNVKKKNTRKFDSETRYILFNSRHHAVRLGKDGELESLQREARSLHEVFGESYRVYDTEVQDNVYHWPLEELEREVG